MRAASRRYCDWKLSVRRPCKWTARYVKGNKEGFKNRGWIDNFKRTSDIHSVVRHGEATSMDAKTPEASAAEFQKLIISECYLPQQVFTCDETGLFWKKVPKRTYSTPKENAMPSHKPIKDRLTHLLCANASRDFSPTVKTCLQKRICHSKYCWL